MQANDLYSAKINWIWAHYSLGTYMKTIKKWRRNAPWWRRASCHSYWLERPAVLCVEETRRPFAGWSSPPQWVAAASAGSHARLENSRWARRSPLKTPHNDELSTKHINTTVTSRFSLPCQWISYIPISAWTNKKTSSRKKVLSKIIWENFMPELPHQQAWLSCIGKNCPFFDYDIMGVRHVSQLSPPPKKNAHSH